MAMKIDDLINPSVLAGAHDAALSVVLKSLLPSDHGKVWLSASLRRLV